MVHSWLLYGLTENLSTLYPLSIKLNEMATIPRHAQDGSIVDVPCPPLLPDYQKYMKGVDSGDQLIGCYNMGRRSKK